MNVSGLNCLRPQAIWIAHELAKGKSIGGGSDGSGGLEHNELFKEDSGMLREGAEELLVSRGMSKLVPAAVLGNQSGNQPSSAAKQFGEALASGLKSVAESSAAQTQALVGLLSPRNNTPGGGNAAAAAATGPPPSAAKLKLAQFNQLFGPVKKRYQVNEVDTQEEKENKRCRVAKLTQLQKYIRQGIVSNDDKITNTLEMIDEDDDPKDALRQLAEDAGFDMSPPFTPT